MALGENVKAASTLLGASLQDHGESVTAPSVSMLEVLNKDDISNDQTVSIPSEAPVPSFAKPVKESHISPDFGIRLGPADPRTPQSYSFFPSLSMGTFGAASLFSHNLSGYTKNQVPTAPAYGAAASQDRSKQTVNHSTVTVTQPSSTADVRQHVGFPTRLPTQQDAPSLKPDESSDSYPPHDSVCKNNVQEASKYSGKSEASTLTYQSQMSSQMAPSVTNAAPAHLVKDSQGSSLCTPTTATSLACIQLNPVSVFPSDEICQNLAVSIKKKRKLISLDKVPWHKEVNSKQPVLHDISTAELFWAETSNRKQEEVRSEAENVAELLPLTRAKRRLTCTTQLMQQLFEPPPAVILRSDARLNCDDVAYCAARLALAGTCSLTCRRVTTDVLRTSTRANSYEFSKVVEGYIYRAKKLESDLSRVDKSLTFVDIKFEAGELEKFSIINRFAKFHRKAHPSKADHSSSSHKNKLQRYVSAFPMPRIVPEGIRCLSL